MFGQQKPTFGQTTTGTAFGGGFSSPATTLQPFGQSTFGKPAASTFGQTPAFGQQNTSLFGSNQPAGGGLFGASSSSGAFGSTTNTQPTFGGFAQQAPNTSLFGTPQQTTQTPLFGQSNSAFGAAKPTGFGSFGQTQPTTSLFGQSTTATTPATGFGTFGQTSAGSVFGNTQPAFGQSLGGATGTAVVKYQPSIGTDTFMKNGTSNNVNTKQHCITAMKEYEGKSFEELRMEDYLANRKGPQAGAQGGLFGPTQPGTSGVFGSTGTQQTTGLFGQQQENKNLFGATGTLGGAGFGQTNTPAFGQTNPTSTGLFAKPFSTPATSNAGFGFGGGTNLFGQTSQATGFGQTSTNFGGFGTPAQTQPSLFGSTNTTTNTFGLGTSTSNTGFGSFGTNTNTNTLSGGLFGNKPATGFGTGAGFGTSTSTATGFGGFGTSNAGGSLFSNTLAKPATSGFGGFGSQPAAPIGGGLNFGNTNTSLFGNNANKPGGSLFGNPAQGTGTNLFGSGSTFGAPNTFGGFGTNTFGSANTLGAPQQQTSSIHQHITALAASPYGDNPIFKDLKIKPSENDSLKATNPAAHKPILDAALGQFKVSSKNVNGVKVKPVGGVLTKKSLFDGLEEYDSTLERSFTLKPNAKRLIIKPKEIKSPNILTLDDSTPKNTSNNQDKENQEINRNNEEIINNNSLLAKTQNMKQKMQSQNRPSSQSSSPNKDDFSHRESWLRKNDNVREQNRSNEQGEISPDNSLSELLPKASSTYVQIGGKSQLQQQQDDNRLRKNNSLQTTSNDNSSINKSYDENRNEEPSTKNVQPHPTGIDLHRVGYYTIPSLDELIQYMSEDGSCIVPNFTVGRHGYGNVFFNEPVDVAGLNLDEIVHFRHKEIILYPDDENKPPVGRGLNREAQITLDQVWPQDKTLHEPIKDPERLAAMDYEGKLRRVCDKHDTRFIEYRPETGSWVFKVKHFSKYGLNDSDEEDVPTDSKKPKMGPKELTAKEKEKTSMEQKLASSSQQQKKSSDDLELSQFKDIQDDLTISKEYLRNDAINDLSAYTVNNSLLIPPTSPTEALARGSGMDAQKLQMMKASFFVEDDMDNRSIASESFDGRCTPDQIVPSSRLFLQNRDQYSSTQSLLKDTSSSKSTIDYNIDSPGIQLTTIDEGSREFEDEQITQIMAYQKIEPLIIKPKIASRKVTNPITYQNSIGLKLEGRCISDMSLYNLRRFKVGFGPQNNLLALNSLNQNINIFGIELKNNMMPQRHIISNNFAPLLHQIKITSARYYDNFDKTVENHLKIQLNHSLKVEVDNSDCPFMKSSCGTELLTKHLNESKNLQKLGDFEEYITSVWSLLQSLWGDRDELEGQNPLNHLSIMCRKNLFSEWLENELTIQKNDDIFTKTNTTSSSNYLEHLFNLLTCHKVYDACELAFRNDDANLSLLLAQISGGPTIRQIIQHQLSSWQKVEADKYISIERLKIFMLIAGINLMSSSHGAINVLDEIHWLKALAVHLWYLCSPTSSVTDILLAYENSFNAEEFYSLPPNPSYYQKYDAKSANNRSLYDLKYHILKLYSKRSHPMESLLNPATHTDDPMDFRLSWFILQTFEALGYHHCSELAETQLHISFAKQLENNGMWYWSIFILLHIKNKEKRELCVQEILYRYVNLLNTPDNQENEKFIVNDLGVPQKWLYWAKAVKAGIYKNYRLQVDYLLKAKQFCLAHEIIMEHIAPDAIINDKIRELYQLLIQFENQKSKKLENVHNWSNRGQILLDYIEMDEKFKKLKTLHESDIETRWESLKPQLADLCSRINLLPCPTAKHRLCQSEIAQKLACLVRGILLTCPILNPCLLIKIALEKLPLPQEFAQQELRVLLDTLVEKMMKTNTLEEVENIK